MLDISWNNLVVHKIYLFLMNPKKHSDVADLQSVPTKDNKPKLWMYTN